MWKKINSKLTNWEQKPLTHITTNINNITTTYSKHDDICQVLLDNNSKIMKDSMGCFPTTPEFLQCYGKAGELNGTHKLISAGEYPQQLHKNSR